MATIFFLGKQGYKFIITEIYDEPKEKEDNRGGNNQKNVKYMMEWIMQCFTEEQINKSYPISYWTSDILGLLNKKIANMPYNDIETDENYSPVDILQGKLYIRQRFIFRLCKCGKISNKEIVHYCSELLTKKRFD